MCKVHALCIDQTEHEEVFDTTACPQRGDIYVGNERSIGAGERLTEDTAGQGKSTRKPWWAVEDSGQYEHRAMAEARLFPILLCINDSNIVEVRTLVPQQRPHRSALANKRWRSCRIARQSAHR